MNTLTKVPNYPDSSSSIAGMAYFAGTGPQGKTCGGCEHRGCYRLSASNRLYKTNGCAMFKRLSGHYGPPVAADNAACKYYELKK